MYMNVRAENETNLHRLNARLPDDSLASRLVVSIADKPELQWQSAMESLILERITQKTQEIIAAGEIPATAPANEN